MERIVAVACVFPFEDPCSFFSSGGFFFFLSNGKRREIPQKWVNALRKNNEKYKKKNTRGFKQTEYNPSYTYIYKERFLCQINKKKRTEEKESRYVGVVVCERSR